MFFSRRQDGNSIENDMVLCYTQLIQIKIAGGKKLWMERKFSRNT